MRILLTNDDGILAPGLAALVKAARSFGDLHVVAPETAQSAVAHSITLTEPLICRSVCLPDDLAGYSVSGRPADCVKLAMAELISPPPELVISGINAGANVGVNVLYSGTVAAALEGAFFGIPAVAISLTLQDRVDFDYAANVAQFVLKLLIERKLLVVGAVLNVNLPACEVGWPKGIRVVRQSSRAWSDRFERRTDPRNRVYFWLDADTVDDSQIDDQTDEKAIIDGYISVTPLKLDLTADESLCALHEGLEDQQH